VEKREKCLLFSKLWGLLSINNKLLYCNNDLGLSIILLDKVWEGDLYRIFINSNIGFNGLLLLGYGVMHSVFVMGFVKYLRFMFSRI
jgi:hypothetical protein